MQKCNLFLVLLEICPIERDSLGSRRPTGAKRMYWYMTKTQPRLLAGFPSLSAAGEGQHVSSQLAGLRIRTSSKLSSGTRNDDVLLSQNSVRFLCTFYVGVLPRVCKYLYSNCVCVCVFSSHSFWTSSSLDVPAGVTQDFSSFFLRCVP